MTGLEMRVGIVMPVYNAAPYVSEAIESVLSQTYGEFQLVLVNDGSTDNSLEILQEYARMDSRIVVLDQPNSGAGAARNLGIHYLSESWVFLLDADDVMLPTRIERQLWFIKENPDVKVASCRASYISSDGNIFGQTAMGIRDREEFRRCIERNEAIGILNPGAVLHRDTVVSIGGFRGEYWPAEDIDLWNRLAERGHLILVQDEVLMRYRVHPGSIITSSFVKGRLRYEWVRACFVARRQGLREPTWEEFQTSWSRRPFGEKLNRWRKLHAKRLYRLAGELVVNRQVAYGGLALVVAIVLQPAYSVPRVIGQVFGKGVHEPSLE